jgi:hypothetical protein
MRSILVLALFLTSCADAEVEKRRAQIQESLAQARALAPGFEKQRRSGLAAAVGGALVPRPDLGACPVPGSLPFGDPPARVSQDRIWKLMALAGGLEVAGIGVLDRPALATTPSPRAAKLEVSLGAIERDLLDPDKLEGPAGAKLVARAADLAQRTWWTCDLVVVADRQILPRQQGAQQFVPGMLVGQAFVWDYQKNQVICSAPVEAHSSSEVTDWRLRINQQDTTQDLHLKELQNDLHINACKNALSRLVLAGPLAADPGP